MTGSVSSGSRASGAPCVFPSRSHCRMPVANAGVLYDGDSQGVPSLHLLLGVVGVDVRGHPSIHAQVGGCGVPVVLDSLAPFI